MSINPFHFSPPRPFVLSRSSGFDFSLSMDHAHRPQDSCPTKLKMFGVGEPVAFKFSNWPGLSDLVFEEKGLLLSKFDFSVQKVLNPLNIDGKSMQKFVEVDDIVCFVNDQPIKKVHLKIQYFWRRIFLHVMSIITAFLRSCWAVYSGRARVCRQGVPYVPTTLPYVWFESSAVGWASGLPICSFFGLPDHILKIRLKNVRLGLGSGGRRKCCSSLWQQALAETRWSKNRENYFWKFVSSPS